MSGDPLPKGAISELPSTRDLLTHILNRLSSYSPPPQPAARPHPQQPSLAATEHSSIPPAAKPLLLTLHSLLPHCLLPALDLLDRGLVERWVPAGASVTSSWVYYVTSKPVLTPNTTSTSTVPGRISPTPGAYVYEVRPSVWHCTCANFAIYAFATASTNHRMAVLEKGEEPCGEGGCGGSHFTHDSSATHVGNWIWGSANLSPSHPGFIPVCKHLLAAVLVERCPAMFETRIKERRDVSREEMAEKVCMWY